MAPPSPSLEVHAVDVQAAHQVAHSDSQALIFVAAVVVTVALLTLA